MDEMMRRVRASLSTLVLMTGMLSGQMNVAFAHDPGRAGDGTGTAGCGRCHGGGTAGTMVEFGGVPTSVAANSVNTFTLTISGGPASVAGLSVTASSGALATMEGDATIRSGELVHTAAAAMTGGSKVYTFTWTAPATAATVMLTGAGVSGDGDGSDSGDGEAKTSISVSVTADNTVVPSISGPTTGTVGASVTFDSSSSTGDIATRNWNFGDSGSPTGVDATGVTASHTYATAGTYTVTLTLIDGQGASTSTTQDITISEVGTHLPPVANAGGPYAGMVGTAVTFDGSASTVDSGLMANYSWNFGDGTAAGTGATPSHTYTMAGSYTVTLTVTDDDPSPLSSTVTTTAVIVDETTPSPSTGQQLYDDNCASCHGAGGIGGADGDVVGASAGAISSAIRSEREMRFLRGVLSADQIAEIANYLQPSVEPSAGEQLYIDNCESCHGAGGVGGPDGDVAGESADDIAEAILEVPEMNSLSVLTEEEIAAIAEYLNGGACASGGSDDDDDDDRSIRRPRSSTSPLDDDDEDDDDDDDDGGSCAGIGTSSNAATKKNAAASVATGAFDLLTLAGIGLLWGRRRKK